jgi:acyl-[acyl-carrier-protein] desaturase
MPPSDAIACPSPVTVRLHAGGVNGAEQAKACAAVACGPVDGSALLDELAPAAGRLLERHLSSAREWFPHELVPWELAAGGTPAITLDRGVESALVLNVLTEDALPYYTAGLSSRFGTTGPWWDWVRRWTAEEMRHGTAIHDYLSVSRAVDLVALERARLAYLSAATIPGAPTVEDALVYLALQELATRIAHANTARLLPDAAGRRLVARVAADEQLHHLFYRDLVAAALAVDPSGTVAAIDRQVRHFAMPGHEIPGFRDHAVAVARAGIYSTEIFLGHVVAPVVLGHWRLAELDGLSSDAERTRRRTLAFVDRIALVAPRLPGATSVEQLDDGARSGSW